MNVTPPTTIGRYEIKEILGRGSMGIVYRAFDPVLEREVAVKTIESHFDTDSSEFAKFIERFKREAVAAGKLNHPNIITIHDFGFINDVTPYIVMELIHGKTLKNYFDDGLRFELSTIKSIIGQIAGALDYAHKAGIVHRDIKPANIMILDNFLVKIADFGIARLPESELTKTGEILGTPNYMSPEQITGTPIDHRVDLFALGVILYQMLTGEKPFFGETFNSLAYRVVHEKPLPPKTLNPSIPNNYSEITMKLLEKDKNLRPTVNDITKALGTPDVVSPVDLVSKTIQSNQIHQLPTQDVQLEELSLWSKSLDFMQSHFTLSLLTIVAVIMLFVIIFYIINHQENAPGQNNNRTAISKSGTKTPEGTGNDSKHNTVSTETSRQPEPKVISNASENKNEKKEEDTVIPEESALIRIPNVRHLHDFGISYCRGSLVFTDDYVQFDASGEHARKWKYKSLRGIELHGYYLKIKTYERREVEVVKVLYKDYKDYNFKLSTQKMNKEVGELLKRKGMM
jgi:serine/threonine protein kinase